MGLIWQILRIGLETQMHKNIESMGLVGTC